MKPGWPSAVLLPLLLAVSVCLFTVEATSQFILPRGQLRVADQGNQRDKQAFVLPRGTSIHVRLSDSIRADGNAARESFSSALDRAIKADDRVLAPEKSRVMGEVTKLRSARKPGAIEIQLVLRTLQIGSRAVPLETETLEFVVPQGAEAMALDRELALDPDVIFRRATRLTFKLSKPIQLSPLDAKER